MYSLGIDIGSKTIKLVLTDEDGTIVYSSYCAHRSQVKINLLSALGDLLWRQGDCQARITVTGSAGMRVAELFGIPFVQEVVALKRAVVAKIPQADVILEMGGEDTKLVYLTGTPEQRMNTVCAGGTGSFIEMMASLMGVHVEDLDGLALRASTIYPIASRCAVFAKSDVRPLLNSGARKSDITASVLDAVCTQAVAGLSAGRPIEGTVVLLGGPFNYIPAMRSSFIRVTGFDPENVIVPENAHLFVAWGAAQSSESSEAVQLSRFRDQVKATKFENEEGIGRLPALFRNRLDYERFCLRHARCRLPRKRVTDASENLFLGIDAGSTTMKVAVIDESGALIDYTYEWNRGDVATSLSDMLQSAYATCFSRWDRQRVMRRSCIVGYGEDFCKAGFGVDMSEVETVAHLRAARAIDPDVDFLMDIGGQDIKCFYVENGQIEDIVLNEACSSGCGSLFDSIARSMHHKKEGFARLALTAKSPVDLGTRCSTFIDSRVKHAQKEGVTPEDIAAGVCYSTVRNALYKVVRQPDFTKVGKHIVVQGGAFANDAILRAFELETGVEVKRPDLSQLMGAWGAALLARDEWLAQGDPDAKSTLIGAADIGRMRIQKTTRMCDQCTNHCMLTLTRFTDKDTQHGGAWTQETPGRSSLKQSYGRSAAVADDGHAPLEDRLYVTGNRCERGLAAIGEAPTNLRKPPNMVKLKNALIAACDRKQPAALDKNQPVVGIPRTLALYESYPFWHAFFTTLGVRVVPAGASTEDLYRKGMASIAAEGSCYPSKLLYGHAIDLAERGAEVLFVPTLTESFAREGLLGISLSKNQPKSCPLVEYAGETLAGNVQGTILESRIIATPDLSDARTLSQACEPLCEGLRQARFHLDEAAVARALEAGRAAYQEFFDTLEQANEKLLARVDGGEFPAALIIGHGYHADEGINHGVDELLGTMGFAVLEQVDYQFARRAAQASSQKGDALWQANVDAFYAAKASENHPHLQLVKIRSFGCGIDALSADKLHDVIRADGRVYAELKMDQIVDLAAVRIRLRSLAYANKQRTEQLACADVPPTFGVFANNLMRAHDFPTYLKSDAAFALLMRKTCAPRSLAPQHIEDIQQAAREQHPEMLDMKLLQFSLVYDGPAEASAAAVTGAGTQGGTDIGADTFDRIVFFGEDGLAFFESWDEVAAYVRFNSAAVERNRQKAEQEKLRRQRLEATRSQKKTPARQDAAAKSEAVNLFKSLYGAGNAQVHSPIGGGNGTAPPNSAANALQAQLERSGKLGEMMADAPKMPAPPGTPSE